MIAIRRLARGFPAFARPSFLCLTLALTLLPAWAWAATESFTGTWIQASVRDDTTPDLRVRASTAAPGVFTYQYYGTADFGTWFHVGGNAYGSGYTSLGGLTPDSNSVATVAGTSTITTVNTIDAEFLRFTQQIEHVDGTRSITKRWLVENYGKNIATDLRLIHGGDTFFGGTDSAKSFYDSNNNMVYLRNANSADWGIMGFNANPASPASHYYSGSYSIGESQALAGLLSDTIDSNYLDAGYYLQWNRASLAPGEIWTIEASEVWTPGGRIQVLAPTNQNVAAGSTVTMSFTVQNLGTSAVDVALAPGSTAPWPISLVGATTRSIAADSSIVVEVDVHVPAGAGGTSALVSLAADAGIDGESVTSVTLDALAVQVAFSPAGLDFGTLDTGTSATQTVTVTNQSTSPVTFGTLAVAAPFGKPSDNCSNVTLSVADTCTFETSFTPTAAGSFDETMQVPVVAPVLINLGVSLTGNAITLLAPTVTTDAVADIAATTATATGAVTADGGAVVTARGVVYNTTGMPTLASSVVAAGSGTGSFVADLDGLAPGTTYFVRAYGTNSVDTTYANEVSFTTSRAAQTIVFDPPALQAFEAGATFGLAATASSGLPVTFASTTPAVCSVDGATVAQVGAGHCAIEVTQAGDATYLPAQATGTIVLDERPALSIEQGATQADPSNAASIVFDVNFSEPVTGFDGSDVVLGGSAGAGSVLVSGSGSSYIVTVGGMVADGTVIATVPADVVVDAAGLGNFAGGSIDNSVLYDSTVPSVTVEQAATQADPANAGPIVFDIVFSEAVGGFDAGDVLLAGTATGGIASITGSGANYTLLVDGMSDGTVIASLGAGAGLDAAGNPGAASSSIDNSVTVDATAPAVTIEQAAGQADPTSTGPVFFTVTFDEPVTLFDAADVEFSGDATGTHAEVAGSGANYTVSVPGVSRGGTVIVSLAANAAVDAAGNASAASSSTDNSVLFDNVVPSVTVEQAATQADPTNGSAIEFNVRFSEPVSGFTTDDVVVAGNAGATGVALTGSGADYAVVISGMASDGLVQVAVGSGAGVDAAGNTSTASASEDNSVTFDATAPTVTLEQGATQADPTNASTVTFTATFSEDVIGFDASDVLLSGTAGASTAQVAGSGMFYTITVSGMSAGGTVIAALPAAAGSDAAGNDSVVSTSVDNSVTFDGDGPAVSIEQAPSQADPTNAEPIGFSVVFAEPVTGFDATDVLLSGSAGATDVVVTGSDASYSVTVSGTVGDGNVIATIASGAAFDEAGNPSLASSSADNAVVYDTTAPTVTVEQPPAQADPTNDASIQFSVVFSEPVTGFEASDVLLSGSAGATGVVLSGEGASYTATVSGMSGSGTVIAALLAAATTDGAGNPSGASTSSDNSVSFDDDGTAVTIDQAAGQADPVNIGPILFSVVFEDTVTGFDASDVLLGGTAGATGVSVDGSGANYTVAVTGMTTDGTVIASIAAGAASDSVGNPSLAASSTDNTVVHDATAPSVTIGQAPAQADPASVGPILFEVEFSEPVTGFDASDVVIGGSADPGTVDVSGSGANYLVAVSGMTGDGSVTATIAANAASDDAGNSSLAAQVLDGTVTLDATGLTVIVEQSAGQADPANDAPVMFTVTFSKAVTGFDAQDVLLSGTANPSEAVVTGSGATYSVAVSGMSRSGSVAMSIRAAAATTVDGADQSSQASTSNDATVTFASVVMNVQPQMIPTLSWKMLMLLGVLMLSIGAIAHRQR